MRRGCAQCHRRLIKKPMKIKQHSAHGDQAFGSTKKYLILLVKVAVTLGLFYWLVSRVDIETVGHILARSSMTPIVLALGTLTTVFLMSCVRWWTLIGHLGLSIPLRQVLPSYYVGLFFNNFLPTGVGGDVVRTIHLKLRGHSAKLLISSALADRIIGLVVMLTLGAVSILLSPELRVEQDQKIYLVTLIALGLVSGGMLFWLSDRLPIGKLTERYRHTRIRRSILEVIHLCFTYRTAVRAVVGAILLSVVVQSLVIVTYYLLATGIGIQLSFVTFFAFVSIVHLATTLPISIGGLGIREGAMVALMTAVGVDVHLATTLTLLYLLVLWLCSMPGAVVLLFDKTRRVAKAQERI